MHVRAAIHVVVQVALVGRHAIDEADEHAVFESCGEARVAGRGVGIDQQPEMLGEALDAVGEAFDVSGLFWGEARGFHTRQGIEII